MIKKGLGIQSILLTVIKLIDINKTAASIHHKCIEEKHNYTFL